MKMKKASSFFLSLLALSNFTQTVNAYWRPDHYYVTGLGAVTWHRDMEIQQANISTIATQSLDTDYHVGYGVAGAVGIGITKCWRFEVEGYFRNNEGKGMMFNDPIAGSNRVSAHFHYRSFSLMANTFYDFCICDCLELYIGGGIGAAWVQFIADPFSVGVPNDCGNPCFACPQCDIDGVIVPCESCCTDSTFQCDCPCTRVVKRSTVGKKRLMEGPAEGTTPSYKLENVRFAYQIMVGFAYTIACNIDAIAGYRLWGTTKEKSRFINNGTIALSEHKAPLVSSLEFGLRFRF